MASAFNKIILIIFAGVIAAGVWYIAIPYIKDMQKGSLNQTIGIEINSADKKPIQMSVGTSTLTVDLAVNEDEKERGLGQRTSLGTDEGMLFVFDSPQYPAMWMKDMLFPIDIAWLDKDFKIVTLQSDISPNTYPKSFNPDLPSMYVLEVNAGYFKAHGISIGDRLQ